MTLNEKGLEAILSNLQIRTEMDRTNPSDYYIEPLEDLVGKQGIKQIFDAVIIHYQATQPVNIQAAIGTLEPVKDIDWVGKWRVQKAIEIMRESVIDPTDADVERVARALATVNYQGGYEKGDNRYVDDMWGQYISEAKAAIAALTNNEKGK